MRSIGSLLVLFLTSICFAEMGGYTRFEEYVRVDKEFRARRTASTLQLKTDLRGEGGSAFAALNFIFLGDRVKIRPIECYLEIYTDHLDVGFGRKIYSFGTADWINPTDILSPRDYSDIYPDMEEMKIGVDSIDMRVYPTDNLSFRLIASPTFTPNRYPMRGVKERTSSMEVVFDPTFPLLPDMKLIDTELLLRAQLTVADIDLSLSMFRGFDRDPDLTVKTHPIGDEGEMPLSPGDKPHGGGETVPMRTLIRPCYKKLYMVGGDMATVIGSVEVHWEGAYYRTEDTNGSLPNVKNPYFYHVCGFSKEILENTTLGLQLAQKFIFNFREPKEFGREEMIARKLNEMSFQNHQTEHIGTVRVAWEGMRESLKAELIGVYNFTADDYLLLPKLSYKPLDPFWIKAGLIISGGEGASPFSMISKHLGDLTFLEVRYSF
ncbi:hypothetical protein J7M22_03515 [Candidatus Poribacteria bacterium]|nr:hypothetical protein [Candidatus Poribacteria bacterium]